MVKYVVLGYNDGEHVSTKHIRALNIVDAHEKAAKFIEKHDKVAVYPDFMNGGKFDEYTAYIAAFQMVKAVFTSIVKNGKPVERIHTETQRTIARECRVMCARLGMEEVQKEGMGYIFRKFDDFSQDTKDMIFKSAFLCLGNASQGVKGCSLFIHDNAACFFDCRDYFSVRHCLHKPGHSPANSLNQSRVGDNNCSCSVTADNSSVNGFVLEGCC